MPSNIELPLQMPTVEEGFCNNLTGEDWVQVLFNKIAQGVAILNAGSGAGTIILNQESAPSAEQRDFLWFKPSTGLIFSWDSGGGAWTSPNRSPAGGSERRFFEGVDTEIWAYDGGDGSNPSVTPPAANVGAMWEIDTNYAGRSPMGPGAIASANPAKNLALSENFGDGAHTITIQELPAHTHPPADDYGSFAGFVSPGEPSTVEATGGTEIERMLQTGATGGDEAMPIVHPCRGIYVIKRTARTNYVAT